MAQRNAIARNRCDFVVQAYSLSVSIRHVLEREAKATISVSTNEEPTECLPPQALVFILLPRSSLQMVAAVACTLCRYFYRLSKLVLT
jgi:hypothetical protein